MRQVLASRGGVIVFRQASPAAVVSTLKRVRHGSMICRGQSRAFAISLFSTGGTSSVSKSRSGSYSVLAEVLRARAGSYAVLTSVQRSRSGSYTVDEPGVVLRSQAGSYQVLACVQRSRTGSYVVLVVESLIRAARSSRRAARMDGAGRRPRQTQ